MAQFKIYGHAAFLRAQHARISELLHGAAVRTLQLPADKRFHRFIPLEPWQFVTPSDRTQAYLVIECVMFSGRSLDARKGLIRAVMDELSSGLGISANDVEITLIESERENWGIRGQHGDEMKLNYKVEV